MNRILMLFLWAVSLFAGTISFAEEMPELATQLSLFSANATENRTLRLNWSLDQQSPAIVKFRIYRGYEELGNFSVLEEIPFRPDSGAADYLFADTLAVPGVSYFYKLSSVGQSKESVFPVVISAAIPLAGRDGGQNTSAPAMILPGEKITLYVRHTAPIKLEQTSPQSKVLIEKQLPAGLYEFEGGNGPVTLKLSGPDNFERTVNWPIP
jgi:hypothetical protein